ncbi:uncharacterized protein LOC143461331 isoform X2 [Clavelina lepadiformis]|uniref:uncharacterized protein LOC143461331 isoform X2 n=1 Tax=Clavelina lepadiformis TaxID=159417 RepID=UPI0040435807
MIRRSSNHSTVAFIMDLKAHMGCGLLLFVVLSFPPQTNSQCARVGCFDCFDWCGTTTTCDVELFKIFCAKTCNACATVSQDCKDLNCQHRCIRDGDSGERRCQCFDGYRLDEDGRTCTDIDECAEDPNLCLNTTEAHCDNTPGSYRCTTCRSFKLGPATYWNYYRKEECCRQNAKNFFQCGSSLTNGGRVVGGRNALFGSWPWMAHIGLEDKICGGTLISDEWVLTAAHCVWKFRNRPGVVRVVLGVLRSTPKNGNIHQQSTTAMRIYIHENYTHTDNDIALIRLRRKAKTGTYVGRVCLPNGEEPEDGEICIATGYGTTEYRGNLATTLQEVSLPIVNSEVCRRSYSNHTNNINPDRYMCAGYEEGVRDTCQGDSGGPLVCQRCKNCDWYIAGVTAFGRRCGSPGYYGIYTRVTAFEPWISQITSIPVTNEECKRAVWTRWGAFTPCNAECGGGKRSRIRHCKYGSANIDIGCRGDTEETVDCNTQSCVDAFWSSYDIGSCSRSCGGGTRTNRRICVNGSPGQKGCEGNASMVENCNERPCPIWGPFGAWSDCTKECGTGTQNSTRVCLNVVVGEEGCRGESKKSRNCNTQICAHWSEYEPWSDCDVTCMQSKERRCVGGKIGNDGCIGDAIINQTCCQAFGQWSQYGECSRTCGGGQRTRTRQCPDPVRCLPDQHGTSTSQSQPCNSGICPGKWTEWSKRGTCSVTCGQGQQEQVRRCEGGEIGGPGCEGNATRVIPCNKTPVWEAWSDYSECSKTCGHGVETRTRVCCGGERSCEGEAQEGRPCNLVTCLPTDQCAQYVNLVDDVTCQVFAKQRYCTSSYQAYMEENCRLTCCKYSDYRSCDLSPQCFLYVRSCHLLWVQKNCKTTCGLPC